MSYSRRRRNGPGSHRRSGRNQLRLAFASNVEARVPPDIVQRVMGHERAATTLDLHTRPPPGPSQSAEVWVVPGDPMFRRFVVPGSPPGLGAGLRRFGSFPATRCSADPSFRALRTVLARACGSLGRSRRPDVPQTSSEEADPGVGAQLAELRVVRETPLPAHVRHARDQICRTPGDGAPDPARRAHRRRQRRRRLAQRQRPAWPIQPHPDKTGGRHDHHRHPRESAPRQAGWACSLRWRQPPGRFSTATRISVYPAPAPR